MFSKDMTIASYDADLFNALLRAFTDEGAVVEVIAPKIGGATVNVVHALKGSRPGANTNLGTGQVARGVVVF